MNNDLTIREKKIALRKEIKRRKAQADSKLFAQLSESVFDHIEALEAFKQAKTVLAYWSLPDEVFTHNFVKKWHKSKAILLPLVVGDKLELRIFSGMECMEVGPAFGILEPSRGDLAESLEIDLVIVPGLAFDTAGKRLGRGKGYYDKLLKNESMLKIGVCFDFQLVDEVPTEPFDIAMDMVITPKTQ
jgi:5-formyltetrahydrofolate cyclo-ligase